MVILGVLLITTNDARTDPGFWVCGECGWCEGPFPTEGAAAKFISGLDHCPGCHAPSYSKHYSCLQR